MNKTKVIEIKRFAVHDGDGIRTTVFLKGCPLKCVWCHNPESIETKPQLAYYAHKCTGCGECAYVCPNNAHKIENGVHIYDRELCNECGKCEEVCLGSALKLYGTEMSVSDLLPTLLEDRDFYETSGGGVTISGGECLIHPDFCAELLKKLKEENINTAVDTCGFVSKQALDKVIPYTDVFLFDLKSVDEDIHKKCTGQSNKIILENLEYIDSQGKDIEIRIPYVPEYNSNQLEKMCNVLKKIKNLTKVRVLAYHNYAGTKYEALGMENTLPETVPSDEEMETVRNYFIDNGINVIK